MLDVRDWRPELGGLGKLHIRHGKGIRGRGPKFRLVPAINGADELIDWWLAEVRHQFGEDWSDPDAPMLPSERHDAVLPRGQPRAGPVLAREGNRGHLPGVLVAMMTNRGRRPGPSGAPGDDQANLPGGWRMARRSGALALISACSLALAACGGAQLRTGTPSAETSQQIGTGPPSLSAVRNGRYIRDVEMGGLRIAPPPAEASRSTLGLTWKRAAGLFRSVSQIQGSHSAAVLGYGRVTLNGSSLPRGVPALHSRSAWVGITWGGATSCPSEAVPSRGAPRRTVVAPPPKRIFTAVVIYATGGHGAIVYTSGGTPPCGGPAVGPSVVEARETISVPWEQVGPVRSGAVTFSYSVPPCASPFSTGATGNVRSGKFTMTVDVSIPLDHFRCQGRVVRTATEGLFPAPGTPGAPVAPRHVELAHGATGPVRMFQLGEKVAGAPA